MLSHFVENAPDCDSCHDCYDWRSFMVLKIKTLQVFEWENE